MEMHSTHNEWKSVAAERFIITLKNKIYKHVISVSKNVYIDKLDSIISECSNTHHRTIKMKPTEVKDNAYIDSIKEVHDKDLKFKVGDHVWISKYQKHFSPRHWNNGLVYRGASLSSWAEGASLALVGHPSSDGVMIKMPYG